MTYKKYPLNKHKCSELNSICLWPINVEYSGVLLSSPCDNENSIIYYNTEEKEQVFELVDLLAFSTHTPLFLETNNKNLSDKLVYLYEGPIYEDSCLNLVRDWLDNDILISDRVSIPLLLSLYNSALKQPEPLAKCIFLFRVIEYYYENFLTSDTKPRYISDYINNLFIEVQSHDFQPLLVEGNRSNKQNYDVIKKWIKYVSTVYGKKTEVDLNYNLGKEIYFIGRCGSAHAKGGKEVILRQENPRDYAQAKEFNVFLELMCRYLIETSYTHINKLRVLNDPLII